MTGRYQLDFLKRIIRRTSRACLHASNQAKVLTPTVRVDNVELMESRCMLNSQSVILGAVYIEEDLGSDQHGDRLEITFTGGAPGTQLTRLVINGDQLPSGFGSGDIFFDTRDDIPSLGADHAFPLTVVARDGIRDVAFEVVDGESELSLTFDGFEANEKLILSIDVDEVEEYFPRDTDLDLINEGFDAITSGVEFQGTEIAGEFIAPHFHPASVTGTFRNRYDDDFADTGLELPADNEDGQRDRTAGAVARVGQSPKPVALSGTVYEDREIDREQDGTDPGIVGVSLALWLKEGEAYVDTGRTSVTDAQGNYRFGKELGLLPGTYQIRQTQPDGYFSVDAFPGTVDGESTGESDGDDPNVITEIYIPLGDTEAVDLDFSEALPASIGGYVYHDRDDDGVRQMAGEEGIPESTIQLIPIATIHPQSSLMLATDSEGFYSFESLAPGTYSIVQTTQPAGFFDGQDSVGLVDGQTSGHVAATGERLDAIRLNSNQVGQEYNFGELGPVSISGHVHLTDSQGNCDPTTHSSRPIAAAEVRLRNEAGIVVDKTTTDQQGRYEFTGLQPGEYSVEELTPIGLFDGQAHVGTVNGQLVGEAIGGGLVQGIRLGPARSGIDYNFCEHPPSSLSGHIYHDRNQNGRMDLGEEPISGAVVDVMDDSGRQVGRVATEDDGSYLVDGLPAGVYSIVEHQPEGYLDGMDRPGTVDGVPSGSANNPGDAIAHVELGWGQTGVDYDFGEILPGSISGYVHTDIVRDCELDTEIGEYLIAGVSMELIDENGQVIQTTVTDDTGGYRFDDVVPGVYTIRQIQPRDFFHGTQRAGDGGGDASEVNRISNIVVGSGDHLVDYVFCEDPPGTLSGFVFHDGPPITLIPGQEIPEDVSHLRDGQRSSNDSMLAGVVIRLGDGLTGDPVMADRALPGMYDPGPITTVTDEDGFYEFVGLQAGNYSVLESQPDGYLDGRDVPGTTSGIAMNQGDPLSPFVLDGLTVDHNHDAIVRILLPPGTLSRENNFSELTTQEVIYPLLDPPPPLPPIERDLLPVPAPPAPPLLLQPDFVPSPMISYGSAGLAHTWHLSVVDAGLPRGQGQDFESTKVLVWNSMALSDHLDVDVHGLRRGDWTLYFGEKSAIVSDATTFHFGLPHALPVSGDFNGDGMSELGIYYRGHWFIDLNGNGTWDEADLWAKLGGSADLPVVGDWDGDGKDDIGVFGPSWPGDPRAIRKEPGLPDVANRPKPIPKNLPPESHDATNGRRVMQLTSTGRPRADLIDHVFRFGSMGDLPVTGDWNGDGIHTIGIFRDGHWFLDTNGDGIWTESDEERFFGRPGDLPVVGDFNGDGIDEIGIHRDGRFYADFNGNGDLDVDEMIEDVAVADGTPVAGDWDGDGTDDVGIFRDTSRESIPPMRSARRGE